MVYLGYTQGIFGVLRASRLQIMVNLCMQSKKTALDVAVECEHWLVVELLMEADQVGVILTIWSSTPGGELHGKTKSSLRMTLDAYLNLTL